MPSGSKKRKAAKKKKVQAANNSNDSPANNPQGNDDPKSQDERDSDGGDAGSLASQDDHNHQHPFGEGEEEGKRAPSPDQSHVTEDMYVEEATRDAESTEKSGLDDVVVTIEKEWEPKEDRESTHIPIQHAEHDKSSSSSSSRSNSDDESQASEKKSKAEAYNLGSEVTSYSNEDKPATVISEEVLKVAENETNRDFDSNSAVESQAFEKKLEEEAYNLGSEVTSYSNEDKPATVISEEVLKVAENETIRDFDGNSAVESATVDNLVKPVLYVTEEVGHATEISANKSVSDVVESGLKECEEKLLPLSNGMSRGELEGNEGKIVSSSGAESSNGVEKTQDSGLHDSSEKQPLVASPPPVVQRTSAFSCCGLFDIFTGSGR